MEKQWTGYCPKCGHGEFEVTMTTTDTVEFMAKIDSESGIDTTEFLTYYAGDWEVDYGHPFECLECSAQFEYAEYWPEMVEADKREKSIRQAAPDLLEVARAAKAHLYFLRERQGGQFERRQDQDLFIMLGKTIAKALGNDSE